MFYINILTNVIISAFEDISTSKDEWNFLTWLWAFDIETKSSYFILLVYERLPISSSSALVFIFSVC